MLIHIENQDVKRKKRGVIKSNLDSPKMTKVCISGSGEVKIEITNVGDASKRSIFEKRQDKQLKKAAMKSEQECDDTVWEDNEDFD